MEEQSVADRSAVATITGYFYQFDRSILSILGLAGEADRVSIECVEDIDIHTATETTAIQCKYYERSDYNHSVIKSAIMYMLEHHKEGLKAGRPSIRYQLHGHFGSGQDKLKLPFDVQFLKDNFLTYSSKKTTHRKHEDLGVTDEELAQFLDLLTIDINAERFEAQFQAIVDSLARRFGCTPFMAEFFYYNNALRIIKELATKADAAGREISKRDFLARIDTSSTLFEEWFIEKRGRAKHLSALRQEYFAAINLSPVERLFVLHLRPDAYRRIDLKQLLKLIVRKYCKISARTSKPFSPYVLIIGIDEAELVVLKQELHDEGVRFVDGHDFKGAVFSPDSVTRVAHAAHGPELRIVSSIDQARQAFRSIRKAREIFEFYHEVAVADLGDAAIRHVSIHVSELEDISSII
ncbi:hypothetical protein HY78_02150 [Rhizorhabdus wittichii DC-6]|nr:hypothetical protein HY78_02150 [Rhizorhabdus wittichii DC-6]